MQINDDQEIVIKTIDKQERKISYGFIKECVTIKLLLEDVDPNAPIPVPNVTSQQLDHIIAIIHNSKSEICAKVCVENYIKEHVLQKDCFVQDTLIALFSVANYLDCKIVMDALFDFVVDYFNDEAILALFEKDPSHKIFTSLPKHLLVQKVLVNQNCLHEWLLTMYEYDGGFTCDQNKFSTFLQASYKCPLRLSKWNEMEKTLQPDIRWGADELQAQFINQNGSCILRFYPYGHMLLTHGTGLHYNRIVPHMFTFFPNKNGSIVVHNNAEGGSKTFCEIELDLVEIDLPDTTTCIHACKNSVARGTSNSIEIYDQSLKNLLYTINFGGKTPTSVALSPDGDLVACVAGNTLYIHSLKLSQTMSFAYDIQKGSIRNLVFNEEGSLLSFSLGFQICTRTIEKSKLSDDKSMLVSNKEFYSQLLDKIPETITYIPGTNFIAFVAEQTLYIINPSVQKIIFKKRMNGFVTNIFFNKNKDTLFFLEELHGKTKEGVCVKKIDINFLHDLNLQLSLQQVMLLKLIQDKIYKGLKLDFSKKENNGLKKIFDSLPCSLQKLLRKRVILSFKDTCFLKAKLLYDGFIEWVKKK